MKKIYEKPSLVVVKLESQEIICGSPTGNQASGAEKIENVGGGYDQPDGNIFNWGDNDTNN